VRGFSSGRPYTMPRLNRREFLKAISAVPVIFTRDRGKDGGVLVNDVHTGLNPTKVRRIERPTSVEEIQKLIKGARKSGRPIAVCGSRHATGGQQFAENAILLDMRQMAHVIGLDSDSGILTVEAGVEWPELIRGYLSMQGNEAKWGIHQKQGGGDHMTLGGALSANAHGHCLGSPPLASDVEWIELVTSDGEVRKCSRSEGKELFALALGGYGLFGVISKIGLRLARRQKVRRHVEAATLAELVGSIERRQAYGALFGYFQYNIDEASLEFMRTGVLTTYGPVGNNIPLGEQNADMDEADLVYLLELAHTNRGWAYARYAKFELSKNNNVEWSDLHQLSSYPLGYHKKVEKHLGPQSEGADLIWEMYVPRDELISFVEDARHVLLKSETRLIYGTVRFIEQDHDSFLAWAKRRYACVIFTPHCSGTPAGMRKAGEVCRELIRAATGRRGSFYLTYNRFAKRGEMDGAYPEFAEFLELKKKYDSVELLQTDWYRHYKNLYL
jgi:FAD/FMN-containing dehydrogenase